MNPRDVAINATDQNRLVFDANIYHPEVIREETECFTDRQKILKELWGWVMGIAERRSRSIALISPRRYGKTAILQRLYNKLFW